MIWRVVVVVICIVIVVSAVWAASDSFEVRVDSPNTFGSNYVIATPTPMPLPVNYSFGMESNQSGNDAFYIDMPLPTTHVVLMKGNRVDQLARFHLCRGTISRCTGGIQSSNANYIDSQGDGIADLLRVYFPWDDFETLLSSIDQDSTESSLAESTTAQGVAISDPSTTSTVTGTTVTGANVTGTNVTGTATTSVVPSTLVEPSIDRHRRIRLTISGELYAWKIAKP
jgi:hypothetical protein